MGRLDPNARAMTWDIVRGLATEGTTLLLTTQYLEEAAVAGHAPRGQLCKTICSLSAWTWRLALKSTSVTQTGMPRFVSSCRAPSSAMTRLPALPASSGCA
jgi:hypothetical protein